MAGDLRPRRDPDPRLGLILLPARRAGRTDRPGHRLAAGLDRWRSVGRPSGRGRGLAACRGSHPAARRPPGPGAGGPAPGLRSDDPEPRSRPAGLPGRVARNRVRHGLRPVRSRLRDARPALRRGGAPGDHGPDASGRFRQHRLLAALGVPGGAGRLARRLPHLRGAASDGDAAPRAPGDPLSARTGPRGRRRDPAGAAAGPLAAPSGPADGRRPRAGRRDHGAGVGPPDHPAPGARYRPCGGRRLRRPHRPGAGRGPTDRDLRPWASPSALDADRRLRARRHRPGSAGGAPAGDRAGARPLRRRERRLFHRPRHGSARAVRPGTLRRSDRPPGTAGARRAGAQPAAGRLPANPHRSRCPLGRARPAGHGQSRPDLRPVAPEDAVRPRCARRREGPERARTAPGERAACAPRRRR